jgi:quercetin dioxygenase-like cupin family protein
MPFLDTRELPEYERLTAVARPGVVAIVPPNTPHSVVALSDGRAIVIDYPLRSD